jgi:hypothetical protein
MASYSLLTVGGLWKLALCSYFDLFGASLPIWHSFLLSPVVNVPNLIS